MRGAVYRSWNRVHVAESGGNMEFTRPFHRWLKERRAELDLTQGDLARRIQYSPETIRKIEAGVLKPSRQIADLMSTHLGVPETQHEAFVAFAVGSREDKPQPKFGNLPNPPTSLLGREREVAAVRDLLDRRDIRFVTLIGMGGVGKTRLAIQVAHEVSQRFADGVWFVALAPITAPEAVLTSIVQELGIDAPAALTSQQVLGRYLRERNLLLVLDNLEQVLDIAPFIADILVTAPGVKVIATSREPLQIAGEQRFMVSPLPIEDISVELFTQRARAVQPSFMLSEANRPTVTEICSKLDGLPLAIELAVARIVLFTPKELLAQLDQRLPLLTGGRRDLPIRQRTLRATLDWSYSLLTSEEQALFRRLGVFAGGFTLSAAQTFCEIDHLPLTTLDGLSALVTKCLLVRRDMGEDESRYFMLETIREYALEKLIETGENANWHRRLAERMAALIDRGDQELALEIDNWRAAFAWVVASERSNGLALSLFPYDDNASCLPISCSEFASALERALAMPPAQNNWAAQVRALDVYGGAIANMADLRRAQHISEAALALCREHNLRPEMVGVLYSLGHHARERGDVMQARAHFQACLQMWHDTNLADPTLANLLLTMAEVEIVAENAAEALRLLDESLVVLSKANPPASPLQRINDLGWEANHRAHAFQLQGDFSKAKTLLHQSLDYFSGKRTGLPFQTWSRSASAYTYQSLGENALSEENLTEARRHSHESLRLHDEFGNKIGITWCLATLAGVATRDEDPERGAQLWGASEAFREQIGCRIASASRLNRERTVAMLRQELGKAHFEAEAATGRALSLELAITLAMHPS